MTTEKKALVRCMGHESHREQCNYCRRLPLTPKMGVRGNDEAAKKWIDPPHGTRLCPQFKARG
jgi:hypothetical protein